MRQSGELVQWNDGRGFGFILGPDRQRVFVHVSAIDGIATRPREGDRVSFTTRLGRDGRLEASNVKIAMANPAPTREALRRGTTTTSPRVSWQVIVAGILAALLLTALLLGRAPLWFLIPYLAMGALSFLLYGADKAYARSGQWRLEEVLLLGVDLCFGVIGGLLAQAVFRHKTRKSSYVAQAAVIAGVHGLWLAGLASGTIDALELSSLMPL